MATRGFIRTAYDGRLLKTPAPNRGFSSSFCVIIGEFRILSSQNRLMRKFRFGNWLTATLECRFLLIS